MLNRDPGRAEVPAVFESSKKSKFRSKIRKFEKKGTPNGTIVQHDPKATDDAHERAAHVYQNVSVHIDSGSCPQGEVFWPNYHKKVLAVDHPVPARAHARQSPGWKLLKCKARQGNAKRVSRTRETINNLNIYLWDHFRTHCVLARRRHLVADLSTLSCPRNPVCPCGLDCVGAR